MQTKILKLQKAANKLETNAKTKKFGKDVITSSRRHKLTLFGKIINCDVMMKLHSDRGIIMIDTEIDSALLRNQESHTLLLYS